MKSCGQNGLDIRNQLVKKVYENGLGEKVRVNEPVTAEERASLTGERLLNVIKYAPRTYTESSTFEDLYKLPLVTRIQQARKLGEALDSRGWKNKQVKSQEHIVNKINLWLNNSSKFRFWLKKHAKHVFNVHMC